MSITTRLHGDEAGQLMKALKPGGAKGAFIRDDHRTGRSD